MKSIKNLILSLFTMASFSLAAEVVQPAAAQADAAPTKNVPTPIYKKISQENLKTLAQKDGASDTGTLNALINDEKDFIDVVREKVEAQFNLDPYTKRQAVFTLLNKYEEANPLPILDVLEDGTWKDLEILCGPKTKPDLYLAAKIDRTVTEVGRATLYRKIIQPTDSFEKLNRQQQIIKKLVEDEALFNDLDSNLRKLAVPENILLSFWGEDILSSLIGNSKFTLPLENKIAFLKKITSWINKEEHLLMANSVTRFSFFMMSLSILAATTFTVPVEGVASLFGSDFGKEVYKAKVCKDCGSLKLDPKYFDECGTCHENTILRSADKSWGDTFHEFNETNSPKELSLFSMTGMIEKGLRPFWGKNRYFKAAVQALAFGFAAYGAWAMARWLREGLQFDAMIQKKLIHLSTYIDSLNNMICAIKKHQILHELMPDITKLDEKIEDLRLLYDDFDHLLNLLETNTFKGKPSFFSFWSRMDVAYRLMEQEKEKFDEIMMAIGELDAQMSIARFYKEMKGKRVECCFPEYVTEDTDGLPSLDAEDFWHPCLNIDKVVANSINIFGKNIVITGPNAGGKSTIMKALVISVIMAQSLGIVPAKMLRFKPFSKIITYMNITDDIAAGNSHFKAGVIRARDVITEVGKMTDGQHAIAVVDEIFNGTTFKEGQAAAYSFINQLGQKPSNIIITTTHFPMMAGLAQTNNRFLNYKVYVNYDQNGKIVYPYKLEPGASDQIVTLKILREEGFADKFIDDAEAVLCTS